MPIVTYVYVVHNKDYKTLFYDMLTTTDYLSRYNICLRHKYIFLRPNGSDNLNNSYSYLLISTCGKQTKYGIIAEMKNNKKNHRLLEQLNFCASLFGPFAHPFPQQPLIGR